MQFFFFFYTLSCVSNKGQFISQSELCTVLMGDVYSRAEPVLCRSWLMKQTAASSQESRQEASYNYEPHGMSRQFSGNTTAVYYALHLHFFLFPAAC